MGSFTMPETVLGVPLWVPDTYDYFDIEPNAMPNGDGCLAVRGDVNTGYKAILPAPTMSVDMLNSGDLVSNRQWAMSCWLNLANLVSAGTGSVMLGCSTQFSTAPFGDVKNVGFPILLGPNGTNGFQYHREPLSNIISPSQSISQRVTGSWQAMQNYWFLFVINSITTGAYNCAINTYMDTYTASAGGDVTGGTASSGTLLSPRYLHIGAYHAGGTGRADLWRIAKWAFHDHALTLTERQSMWDAMYGAGPFVYADDFNATTVSSNWVTVSGFSAFQKVGTTEVESDSLTLRWMNWVRNLRTTKHYAKAIFTGSNSAQAHMVAVRMAPYGSNATGYVAGWDGAAAGWRIFRVISGSFTSIATGTTAPTAPYTVELQAEAAAGNTVDLRLYVDGVLKTSVNDSNAARILVGENAGMYLRGSTGIPARATNFECGTF